eukprot:SRR837773.15129.p1 GENE.SRR837773.15129~~SRR837773.15129.p1  ORF type:complete len:356 (-),score=105.51 SRR837773.15129:63-986(-)
MGGASKGWNVQDLAGGSGKGLFLRGRRRRMALRPMLLSILAPWLLFCVVYAALAFTIHYEAPLLCWLVVAVAFLAVVASGLVACSAGGRRFANPEHEPTWLVFLFLTMLLAFVVAFILGNSNFNGTMQMYFNMRSLNNYTQVSPARMRGQQLMDAGVLQFVPGTRLDITRSSGFKNNKMYCVAPITVGDVQLATYDFWAVGTDCCLGLAGGFHCPNFNNPHANGGLRLMNDEDRAFYRLAVQQAEATYNIKAVHPLFFEWSVDPMATVDGWKLSGRNECVVWLSTYLIFQTFLVAVAALAFSKLGSS